MRLTLPVLLLAAFLASPALAQQTPTEPATVEIFHSDAAWQPGRPLAVCVQTGLRAAGAVGAHRLEYRFAHRSTEGNETRSLIPDATLYWADTSFMLVDDAGNLVSLVTGQVRGRDKEQIESRAINGDALLPGGAGFNHVCGELTGTTIAFVPREPFVPVPK